MKIMFAVTKSKRINLPSPLSSGDFFPFLSFKIYATERRSGQINSLEIDYFIKQSEAIGQPGLHAQVLVVAASNLEDEVAQVWDVMDKIQKQSPKIVINKTV